MPGCTYLAEVVPTYGHSRAKKLRECAHAFSNWLSAGRRWRRMKLSSYHSTQESRDAVHEAIHEAICEGIFMDHVCRGARSLCSDNEARRHGAGARATTGRGTTSCRTSG